MITPKKGLAAVIVLLLCCALLNQHWTGWFTSRVTWTVKTLQFPAGWLASKVRVDPPVDYPEIPDDDLNDLLSRANRVNLALWEENKNLSSQLEAYKAIAEIQDIKKVRPVEARVSQVNDDPTNPVMTLLRGSLQGIKQGDPVVYRSELIGFVESASPMTSTVNLITRASYRTEIRIMAPGQVEFANNWPVMTRANSDGRGGFEAEVGKEIAQALRPGDLIHVSDTLRPAANGFVLGAIQNIKDHETRPLQLKTLVIKPRTPIGRQPMVTVLTDRPKEASN